MDDSNNRSQPVLARSCTTKAARPKRRALWLGVYFAALSLLAGVVLTRRVAADMSERSLALGRRLDSFVDLSGKATELSWNGQALALSSLVVEQPVEQVLTRFVSLCNDNMGTMPGELTAALGAGKLGEPAVGLLRRALVPQALSEDGTGYAVCLAGLGEGGLTGLGQRARRFAEARDFSELGHLRYAYLRKVNDQRTHVLLVTADGSLTLDKIMPVEGHDAEGEDIIPGVRPVDATRIIVARAKGTPHAFAAYQSRLTPDAALADYGQKLRAKGFLRADFPTGQPEPNGSADPARIFTEAYRRGPQAFVVASRQQDQGSVLSVVQLAELPIPRPDQASDVARERVGRGRLGTSRDPAFE
jgi:hypothetical protein